MTAMIGVGLLRRTVGVPTTVEPVLPPLGNSASSGDEVVPMLLYVIVLPVVGQYVFSFHACPFGFIKWLEPMKMHRTL